MPDLSSLRATAEAGMRHPSMPVAVFPEDLTALLAVVEYVVAAQDRPHCDFVHEVGLLRRLEALGE